MSSSRNDRGRRPAGRTRASQDSSELRQKRQLRSPVADPLWSDTGNLTSETRKRANPAAVRRNASLQKPSRNEPPSDPKRVVRKGSVENRPASQKRARNASPKDEFTHGLDNIEQVRKTFFKGTRPDRPRKSTSNLPKENPVLRKALNDDSELLIPTNASKGQRKSLLPTRKKEEKPLSKPDPEQMHGKVIQKVVYETEQTKPEPKSSTPNPDIPKDTKPEKPVPDVKPVPKSIRQTKTTVEDPPRPKEESPKVLTSKDRAALRIAQLAQLKQVDVDLGNSLQRRNLIDRIRGILEAQEDEEEESESEKQEPPQRLRVSFDFSNAPTEGKPMPKKFDIPDYLEIEGDFEPFEEKPFAEPTDFLKAYRFPKEYMAATVEEEEEEAEPVPKKAPPIPEPEPEPLPKNEDSTDDSVVSLSLIRPDTPEKKPRKAEFSPIKSDMDKFSESVSLDEFVQLENEMMDQEEDEDEFDMCCPNFSKLSLVIKKPSKALRVMTEHKLEHFVFLISQNDFEVRGIYLLRANLKEIVKIWGDGPEILKAGDIYQYWYFNAVSKVFENAKKPGLRHNLDAVSL